MMLYKKALVTGGAGFIGSHIVEALVSQGTRVVVYDNLRTGFRDYLLPHGAAVEFVQGDVLETARLAKACTGCEAVFHFAANADVRGGMENTLIDLRENVTGTHSVLESARHAGVRDFVFASSATVYGEPEVFPTPEDTALVQTSVYGASKLSGEAYIQAYSEYFGMRSFIFRFVSWIGERYSHGVVYDFIKKLRKDPTTLEILGDGEQKKSYLYVKDGVDGIFTALRQSKVQKNVFNLGHDSWMNVKELAGIVVTEMGLDPVRFTFGGGKRGWLGDSPFVHLDTSRLKALGWAAQTSIETGIRRTARYLLDNPRVMDHRG